MARRIVPQRARPESATLMQLSECVGIAILSVFSPQTSQCDLSNDIKQQ